MPRARRFALPPLAIAGIAGLLAFGPGTALAGCSEAFVRAAHRHGIPPALMLAIGDVESGQHPLAINIDGRSHFPASSDLAVALVRQASDAGHRNIDVGCGQINLRSHPTAFEDLRDAFDPDSNSDYAARFLAGLRTRHGTWTAATAHYHSATPHHQRRYVCSVATALGQRTGQGVGCTAETVTIARTSSGPATARAGGATRHDTGSGASGGSHVVQLRAERLSQARGGILTPETGGRVVPLEGR